MPTRTPSTSPPDLSAHARTLEVAHLQHGDVVRYDVTTGNSIVGRSADDVTELLPDEVDLVDVETVDGLSLPDSVDVGDVVIVRRPTDAISEVDPKLYVEIDGQVAPDATVAQEHGVQTSLRERLETLPYEIWLDLELTPRTEPSP